MSQKFKRSEIEKRLKILRIDKKKLSKLNLECTYGHTRNVIFFLDQNYEIDDEDENCVTPLMVSCMFGYTRLPELLINRGADVNKPNKYGVTPLHMAACYGNLSTVQLLLYHGANESAEADDFITPYDYTVNKWSPSYDKIRELLVFYAEKKSSEIQAIDDALAALIA